MIKLDMFNVGERETLLWNLEKLKKGNGSLRKALFAILSTFQRNEEKINDMLKQLEKIEEQK